MHTRAEESEPWVAAVPGSERAGAWGGPRRQCAELLADHDRGLFANESVTCQAHRAGRGHRQPSGRRSHTSAMTSWLCPTRHGYGFKMAYDEAWRHCAAGPGLLICSGWRACCDENPHCCFDTWPPKKCAAIPLWPADAGELGDFVCRDRRRNRRGCWTCLWTLQRIWGAAPAPEAAFLPRSQRA